MNLARRNSQFLGAMAALRRDVEALAQHEAWLRQVEEYSAEREAWGNRETEWRKTVAAQLLQGEKDWDGSESDLVGLTNAEVGE